ncbi:hypothetical protein AJ79_00899 [Helicocarpus griseus UAMH5409]|uniref:Uncharacterized protein n=1 Tax=Helicocarpus griseus UAMH5409 TaxID=1447875 RepID=A0A2B7YA11_9EURO|nr:hypothetical protein AJ79_00899 [Helicocarpus griseus UAMH5409]
MAEFINYPSQGRRDSTGTIDAPLMDINKSEYDAIIGLLMLNNQSNEQIQGAEHQLRGCFKHCLRFTGDSDPRYNLKGGQTDSSAADYEAASILAGMKNYAAQPQSTCSTEYNTPESWVPSLPPGMTTPRASSAPASSSRRPSADSHSSAQTVLEPLSPLQPAPQQQLRRLTRERKESRRLQELKEGDREVKKPRLMN